MVVISFVAATLISNSSNVSPNLALSTEFVLKAVGKADVKDPTKFSATLYATLVDKKTGRVIGKGDAVGTLSGTRKGSKVEIEWRLQKGLLKSVSTHRENVSSAIGVMHRITESKEAFAGYTGIILQSGGATLLPADTWEAIYTLLLVKGK